MTDAPRWRRSLSWRGPRSWRGAPPWQRIGVVVGLLLLLFFAARGVIAKAGGPGRQGIAEGNWALVSPAPGSSHVEVIAIEGGCRRFDHARASYGLHTITIVSYDKVSGGACPADLLLVRESVQLPGPVGNRDIVGACSASVRACADAQLVASQPPPAPQRAEP